MLILAQHVGMVYVNIKLAANRDNVLGQHVGRKPANMLARFATPVTTFEKIHIILKP